MSRGRWALLGTAIGLACLLCAGLWALQPAPPREVKGAPELQREAVRVVARAQQQAPAAPDEPPERVECAMWRTIGDTSELQLEEIDPETLEPLGWLFPERMVAAMRFTPRRPVGLGWLHLTGHEPAVISWAAGSCLDFVELEEHPHVTVSGRVTGVVETGAVSVAARCGDVFASFGSPQPPEALFEVRLPADANACVISVRRVFGGRDLTVEYPVAARAQEGLELAVAEAPGVGLGLTEVPEGLRVYGVEPGSPAADAGVEMMDLVVAVDGEPAADLVADELVEDEGPLLLEILRGDARLELRVE
jgi:hypothetical protein